MNLDHAIDVKDFDIQSDGVEVAHKGLPYHVNVVRDPYQEIQDDWLGKFTDKQPDTPVWGDRQQHKLFSVGDELPKGTLWRFSWYGDHVDDGQYFLQLCGREDGFHYGWNDCPLHTYLVNDGDDDIELYEKIDTPKWLKPETFDGLIVIFKLGLKPKAIRKLIPSCLKALKEWTDAGNFVDTDVANAEVTRKELADLHTHWRYNDSKFWEPRQDCYSNEEWETMNEQTVKNLLEGWQRAEDFINNVWSYYYLEITCPLTGENVYSYNFESDSDDTSIQEILTEYLEELRGQTKDAIKNHKAAKEIAAAIGISYELAIAIVNENGVDGINELQDKLGLWSVLNE